MGAEDAALEDGKLVLAKGRKLRNLPIVGSDPAVPLGTAYLLRRPQPPPSARSLRDAEPTEQIRRIHADNYGARPLAERGPHTVVFVDITRRALATEWRIRPRTSGRRPPGAAPSGWPGQP